MKKVLVTVVLIAILMVISPCTFTFAQTTPTASWPVCKLGKAPIAPGPAPEEATVFPVKGGPVVMSEAGVAGVVKLIRCNLPANTPSYRGADGVLRDVASNQPFFPVGWDAATSEILQGPAGPKGDKGDIGPQGPAGPATSSSSLPQAPSPSVINNIYMPPPASPVVDTTANYGPYIAPTNHHWGRWIASGAVVLGTVAIIIATHHTTTNKGVPPSGSTDPAF
jgi:hypothetical protein